MITKPYTNKTLSNYGLWLGSIPWDYTSTITYRFDIKGKQNFNIMSGLDSHLSYHSDNHFLFWVMEFTVTGRSHNHLLIRGKEIPGLMDDYFLKRGLIDKRFVKHIPYDSSKGAAIYVCKNLNQPNVEYGIIPSK